MEETDKFVCKNCGEDLVHGTCVAHCPNCDAAHCPKCFNLMVNTDDWDMDAYTYGKCSVCDHECCGGCI